MTRIGLLSDTHGYLDKRVLEHFAEVDEIWHAGDIGSMEVLQKLREFKPTRAVYGNMDSGDVRYSLSEFYRFRVEDVNVLMTHIGGYPGKYNPSIPTHFRRLCIFTYSHRSISLLSKLLCLHLISVDDFSKNFATTDRALLSSQTRRSIFSLCHIV